MKEPISPCECSLDDHWDSLGELTVVVFTRDRSREVTRLLSSLTGVPCRVLVYDNGSQPLPESVRNLSPRQEYSFRPGHWAGNWRQAALGLRTPFVCLVDDDGLLEPNGAGNALCRLRREASAVAVEGATGDFIVHNRTAVVHWRPTESSVDLARNDGPLDRWRAVFDPFSYAPWYAVHRSESFTKALTYAADVEEYSSSRNVSTPLLIGMIAIQGPIIKIPDIVSLREVALPPNDPQAMDLWVGDWLTQPQFSGEVSRVENLTRLALDEAELSSAEDVEAAIGIFRSFGMTQMHAPPDKTPSACFLVRRLARSLRRRLRRSEPLRAVVQGDPGPRSTRLVCGVDGFRRYGDEDQTVVWSRHDAIRTMHALRVEEIAVVKSPRELRMASSP